MARLPVPRRGHEKETKVAAAIADAGTDLQAAPQARVGHAAHGDLAHAAEVSRKVDQRIALAVAVLARKVVLLAAATAASAVVNDWQKRQRASQRLDKRASVRRPRTRA
mgnify:CR=1 FL=1